MYLSKYFKSCKNTILANISFVYVIIFILILIVTFLLSSRMILAGDFFYLFDQARDYLLTKEIIDNKNITLIGTHSGLGGFFHGPLWLYMLIPIFMLGDGNPISFAYFYIFLQLLTVSVAFFVGYKLYDIKAGLIISALTAFTPVTWFTTPNFIGVNLVPLVFLLMFYFLVRYIRGNLYSYIPAIFFAGLSLQFETALPLMIIPIAIGTFFINKKAIKNLKLILLSGLSLVISLSTFILFDLKHNFLMTSSVINSFSQEKGKDYLSFSERIPSHFQSLINTYRTILIDQNSLLLGLFLIIFASAIILILKNKSKYKKEFIYLLIFPLVTFCLFIFYSYPIWPEYVFGLIIPIILAFYIAIITIWSYPLGKAVVIFYFVVSFFIAFSYIQNQYFKEYLQNSTSGSYLNQKMVVEWIYDDAKSGKFGYFVYTPETYTHGMNYLIDWENKNHDGVVLENHKEKITYLILYPKLANDHGAHDFWKKYVIKTDSRVLERKTFPGGIIVEKLQIDPNEPPVDPNYHQGLIFR